MVEIEPLRLGLELGLGLGRAGDWVQQVGSRMEFRNTEEILKNNPAI